MVSTAVMGIDIGTSGCKCILIDEKGAIISSASAEYPLYQPHPGWTEQDPSDWYCAMCKCTKQLVEAHQDIRILGVSFSGQMHGMVALNSNGDVIRNAILWNDQRTADQCAELTSIAGGIDSLISMTNNNILTGYTAGKILWMQQNEPSNFEHTQVIVNPKDYVRFRLSGEIATDVSDGSGFGLFNVKSRNWSWELIDSIGWNRSLFPSILESTDQAGSVNHEAAVESGIPEGTPLFAGGGDAVISTTGMGLVQAGKVGVTLGTSGVVAMGLPNFAPNPQGKLQVFCNNKPGTWHAMGVTLAAAGSYQWFRNVFAAEELRREQQEGVSSYEQLNALANSVPAGSDGLLFLPYLTGERCPVNDPDARGMFVGFTSFHSKGHFARSVLEGVAFSLKQVYDLILSLDKNIVSDSILISGGGARSELWRQIFADVFGLPVRTVYGSAEGGAYGAALVAGIGCGLWDGWDHAMSLIKPDNVTYPNDDNLEVYQRLYRKYVKLYDSFRACIGH